MVIIIFYFYRIFLNNYQLSTIEKYIYIHIMRELKSGCIRLPKFVDKSKIKTKFRVCIGL